MVVGSSYFIMINDNHVDIGDTTDRIIRKKKLNLHLLNLVELN